MNIVKKCQHRGPIKIYQGRRIFTFAPLIFRNQFAVLYEISTEENEKHQLLLETKRVKDSTNIMMVTLLREDHLLHDENILKMSLKTAFFAPYSTSDKTELDKTLQIEGDYSLTSDGGMVEAMFNYINGSKYNLIVNQHKNIYEAHKWLCEIWRPRSNYVEFCICLNNERIEESRIFADYYNNGTINFNVTEICKLIPITHDDLTQTIPWSNKSQLMIDSLSKLLEVESSTIMLLDNEGRYLRNDEVLNKESFRNEVDGDYLTLFYEIKDSKVTCKSLKEGETLVLMVYKERTVAEVKSRLSEQLSIKQEKLMVCNKKVIVANNDSICDMKDLSYCVGLSDDEIEIECVLGEGTYGIVKKCFEKSSKRTVALKMFRRQSDLKINKDLIREFLIMFSLEPHKNIVQYFDIFVNGNNIWISMEYISGGSLADYLYNKTKVLITKDIEEYINKDLNEDDIKKFSEDILKGLKHLHDNKIIHRDIKSFNVLVENKNCKLCDFGIARILSEYTSTQLSKGVPLTNSVGSYRWIAPEVLNGNFYGKRADIWSVGATVVEMITRKLPHHEIERNETVIFNVGMYKVIEYTPPQSLSEELKEFVDFCLKSESEERLNVESLLLLPFFKK